MDRDIKLSYKLKVFDNNLIPEENPSKSGLGKTFGAAFILRFS